MGQVDEPVTEPSRGGLEGRARVGLDGEGRPAFAHASEAEFARILDFYGVRWEYEPDTFPILWDLEGTVLESFSPDFHLPDLDLYVELTTLQQRLVRKKNRKVRRLRELYPEIRIKLFYARDFRALLLKYGRVALVGELSGSLGQVTARRNHPAGPDAPVTFLPAMSVSGESRAGADIHGPLDVLPRQRTAPVPRGLAVSMAVAAEGDAVVAADGDAVSPDASTTGGATIWPSVASSPTARARPRRRHRASRRPPLDGRPDAPSPVRSAVPAATADPSLVTRPAVPRPAATRSAR